MPSPHLLERRSVPDVCCTPPLAVRTTVVDGGKAGCRSELAQVRHLVTAAAQRRDEVLLVGLGTADHGLVCAGDDDAQRRRRRLPWQGHERPAMVESNRA
jgi:hypothetical protein